MARTVADAAILLVRDAGVDPRDARRRASAARPRDYTASLEADGLKGARIGVARKQLLRLQPGDRSRSSRRRSRELKTAGRGRSSIRRTSRPRRSSDDCELEVLLYEFKADLNAYLATLGPARAVHSLDGAHRLQRARASDARCRTSVRSCCPAAEKKGR